MKRGDIFNPWKLFIGLFVPNALARYTGLTPGAKLLYGRLAQYAGKDGACYPSQDALAEEIGVADRQVRNYLQELVKNEFIRVDNPKGIDRLRHKTNRYVFLWHSIFCLSGAELECRSGQELDFRSGAELECRSYKGVEENQQKENQKKENQKREARTIKLFTPPTLSDVQSYCSEIGQGLDPQRFIDYYTANAWKVGRNPMRDWKAAVRNWGRREFDSPSHIHDRKQRSRYRCEDSRKYDAVSVEVFT